MSLDCIVLLRGNGAFLFCFCAFITIVNMTKKGAEYPVYGRGAEKMRRENTIYGKPVDKTRLFP